MRKLFLFIAAALVSTSMWAATTLFTTNFSTTDGWSNENLTTSEQASSTKTIKGTTISFKGYKSASARVSGATASGGTFTFTSNNLSASAGSADDANYYMAIPVSGVQHGIVTVKLKATSNVQFYYTYDDGNTGNIVDRLQSTEYGKFTINGLENENVTIYIGNNAKSITELTITTPDFVDLAESTFYQLYASTSKTYTQLIDDASFPDYISTDINNVNSASSNTSSVSTPHDFTALGSGTYYRLKTNSNIKIEFEALSHVKSIRLYGNGNGGGRTVTVTATKIFGTGTAPTISSMSMANSPKTIVEYSTGDLTALDGYDAETYYSYTITFPGACDVWGVYVEHVAPSSYTITYAKGEYGSGDDIADGTKTHNVAFTLSSETYFRSGYTQEGWATTDGGPKAYDLGGSYTANADITLYPYWEEITGTSHAIEYTNLKGQSVDGYPTEYFEGYGVPSFEPLNDIDGWHFAGWSPASISETANEDKVIAAVWKEIFTVSFNTVGGSEIDPINVVDGETAVAPTAPTRLNWTFQKWQLNGVDYDFSIAVTEDITLDAVWTRNSISGTSTENYTADTEHGKEVESTSSYTATSFTLKKIDDKAWSIAKDNSSATSSDSKIFEYAFLPGNSSSNTQGFELTATKDINSLTVYYTMTDSKFTSSDQSKPGNFTYQINSNAAVVSTITGNKSNKTAYKDIISGISEDDVVKLYSSESRLAIFAIYASYATDPLYVKFTVNGVKTDSITTTTGEKLGNLFIDGKLPEPVVSGYTFNGWKNAAGDAAVDKNTAVGEVSLVLYADLTKDPSTGIENQESKIDNRKFIKDGQIFIEKNGHVYNVFGACVK